MAAIRNPATAIPAPRTGCSLLRAVCIIMAVATISAHGGGLLDRSREGPLKGVREIVFAVRGVGPDGHWYANFGSYAPRRMCKIQLYPSGSSLRAVDLETGQQRILLDDPKGGIRDPQVHYDGRKILFSYRPGGNDHYHLYEIGTDGTNLRQLTDGPFDDIEPIYLPNDEIVFVSSRCNRWVNCWLTQVAILHRCDRDGNNIRAISMNIEQDNTPWVLPDGRLLYTRWEYIDRSQVHYHHLWTANPDGTAPMTFFGNLHPGTVMIDSKPVPGSERVISVFSPGHGRRNTPAASRLSIPRPVRTIQSSARILTKGDDYRDPWAFSEDCVLAACGASLVRIDGAGHEQTIFTLTNAEIEGRSALP